MRAVVFIIAAVGCADSPPPEPPADSAPETTATASTPVPSPVEAALSAYAEACRAGDASACLASGKPGDACLHGDGSGCYAMAQERPAKSADYLARACRRGHDPACAKLPERPDKPRIAAAGLGAYRHAVLDCWAETEGIDRDRAVRGTIAVTTDLDGSTTAIARFEHEGFRRCVETSASRWAIDGNRDVDLTIRPPFGSPDSFAVIGTLKGGGIKGGVVGGVLGGGGLSSGGSGTGLGLGGRGGIGTRGGSGKTSVRVYTSTSDDTLDKDVVERAIRTRYRGGIERCYRRAQRRAKPSLSAVIRLRFTVTPTGAVDDVRASSTGPDRLRRCVEEMAPRWRFAPPRTGAGDPATAAFRLSIYLSPRR